MSIAIANTQNNLGIRTLAAYNPRLVRRGPAEPGPRAAENPVALGALPISNVMIPTIGVDQGYPISHMIYVSDHGTFRQDPISPINIPVPPTPPNLNPNGTASQAPTGSIINATLPLNAQIAPSVATQVAPAMTPTATANIAPASQPGYVVITSGGGTTANQAAPSPDYFAELEAWLTSKSLISAVPNWVPLVGVAVLLGVVWRGKHR